MMMMNLMMPSLNDDDDDDEDDNNDDDEDDDDLSTRNAAVAAAALDRSTPLSPTTWCRRNLRSPPAPLLLLSPRSARVAPMTGSLLPPRVDSGYQNADPDPGLISRPGSSSRGGVGTEELCPGPADPRPPMSAHAAGVSEGGCSGLPVSHMSGR